MSKILNIHARQIFDSRGNPTVEVEVTTRKGVFRAAVPSGASTGIHEAIELRDGGVAYGGKGVLTAVKNVNVAIAEALIGESVTNQKKIDGALIALDGTKNKNKLGANAILGVSMAVARAGAAQRKLPLYTYIAKLAKNEKLVLPIPFMNIINGGKHADSGLDAQEFMIAPVGAKSFTQAMQMGSEIYHILKNIIKEKYGGSSTSVGDEGGFAPNVKNSDDAAQLIEQAIKLAGYDGKVRLALDAAASEYYNNDEKKYHFEGKLLTDKEIAIRYREIAKQHNIISFEDPFDQDDFAGYRNFTSNVRCQVVGDDLLVTNVERMKIAHSKKACNALLLKVNQIGTVTESIAAANLAKKYGWSVMVSHRSGETEDAFIADLVVGLGVGQIKTGAPCRSERLAKYNQLLRIEEELTNSKIQFSYGDISLKKR